MDAAAAEDAARVLVQATALCAQTSLREQHEYGVLPPSVAMSPLDPPYSSEEYEVVERDEAQYLLYGAAIRAAYTDILRKRTLDDGLRQAPLRTIVVGAGYGRCVPSAADHLTD